MSNETRDQNLVAPGCGPDECGCTPELAPSRNSFELFTEGDELYQSMLASIASAERSIESHIVKVQRNSGNSNAVNTIAVNGLTDVQSFANALWVVLKL